MVTDLHGITEAGSEVRGLEYGVLGQLEVRVGGTVPRLAVASSEVYWRC